MLDLDRCHGCLTCADALKEVPHVVAGLLAFVKLENDFVDFVVVGFSAVELQYVDGDYLAATDFPEVSGLPIDRAIVAWVSQGDQQAPLQSVGGLLPST